MKWMKKHTQLSPCFWTALGERERKRERSQSRETVQGEREIARSRERIEELLRPEIVPPILTQKNTEL